MNEAEFSCRISKMDLCMFSSVELGDVKKKFAQGVVPQWVSSAGPKLINK